MSNCTHCHQPQSAAPVICPKCYEELTRDNERLTAQLAESERQRAAAVETRLERVKFTKETQMDGSNCEKKWRPPMEKTELLACPFCGGEAVIDPVGGVHPDGHRSVRIACSNISTFGHQKIDPCQITPISAIFDTEEQSIVAWNRRAPLPDNKPLTCEGCECEEGQRPSRCRSCMRYGDRADNYRRQPEKGE